MKKVIIFSDSHGNNSNMKSIIKKEAPDLIIHAGDHCLSNVESVYLISDFFVAGNNDYIGQEYEIFDYEGVKFVLTHGHWQYSYSVDKWEEKLYKEYSSLNPDIIVYGHSHVERFSRINNTIIINPGSIERPRNYSLRKSYAIIHIDNGKIVENSLEEVVKYL